MKELTLINKAIKATLKEIKEWNKFLNDLEKRKKELSNKNK